MNTGSARGWVAAGLLLATGIVKSQAPTSNLPQPFTLKIDEFRAGNPLAPYAELFKREKEYVADPIWPSGYWQARGTIAAFLGDTLEATEDWDKAAPSDSGEKILLTTRLEKMHPEDAVAVIGRAAETHSWILIGEEHLKPQTRSILPNLLRTLYEKGFRTLAVETFADDAPDLMKKDGYPSLKIGTYTADPVFGAGIREAIRLGYRLVPYEAREQPQDQRPNDPMYSQNFREHLQAQNLKERIFDKDPKAKVIVWAGRSHASKTPMTGFSEGTTLKPMGAELSRMTGIDPFTVYLPTFTEASARRFEQPLYKWATDRELVRRPTIFVDKEGKPFGSDGFDAYVFFPRTTISHGRPDWLTRDMGLRHSPLPLSLVHPTGLQMAQVFANGEPVTAVPVDQIILLPGDPVPDLVLPRHGSYWVRVVNPDGKENGRQKLG